ncbi:MAG: MBL fold metallo-hydrolase, partial [Nocardioidaceae bacterium]
DSLLIKAGSGALTHGHPDHSEGARTFAEHVGCGVRALDPTCVYGGEGLHDGDVVEMDGLQVRIVGTPGHTSDSLSFVLPAERAVLTGDTVLGRGTTVVAHPDGALGAYLGSLRRLRDLAEQRDIGVIWPGHGPVLDDALPVLDYYLQHRAERLEQVRDAVAAGAVEAMDVVRTVYADVDEQLWPAAELSVRAQLDYLHSP